MTNTTTTTTTQAPSDLTTDDPRPIFAKAVGLATEVIGAVAPDQLGRPTPCDEFTVRELLGHVVDVMARVRLVGEGGDPMANGKVDPGSVPDDGWLDLFAAGAVDVEAAWADDVSLDRTIVLPWATMSGAVALATYTNELTVHTWDLARSTDQHPAWDAEVVGLALDAVHRSLPSPTRQAMFEAILAGMPEEIRPTSPPYGDAVELSEGSPMIDQLVAWTGRRP